MTDQINNGQPDPLSEQQSNNDAVKPAEDTYRWHRAGRHRRPGSHRSKKKKHRKKISLDTIFARYLVKIFGVLFLLGGLFWLYVVGDSFDLVRLFLNNIFSAGSDKEMTPLAVGESFSAFLYLLPGIILIAFSSLNKYSFNGRSWLTSTSFIIGILFLFLAHQFNIFSCLFTNFWLYPSLKIAIAITLCIITPIVYLTSRLHKPWIHFLSILFIYISVLTLAAIYGVNQSLFILVFLFLILLSKFSGVTLGSTINSANSYFAIGYFLLFFFRKFLLKESPDQVWIYFGYSSMLYLIVMFISIVKPYEGENIFKKYFNNSLIFSATALYFFTTQYLFRHYGYTYLQGLCTLFLTGEILVFIRISKIVKPTYSRTSYYYLAIIIAASFIPLIIQQGMIVLYSSLLSLLLILFANYRKNQFAVYASTGILGFALLMLLFRMTFYYYPALYFETRDLPILPFLAGIFSGTMVTVAAYIIKTQFASVNFLHDKKWFNKTITGHYLTSIFYLALYFTCFWLFQYVLFALFNVRGAHLINWYIFHITFLLIIQSFVLNRRSWVYKPFLWIAIISLSAMPVAFNLFVIQLRTLALSVGGASLGSFYFHFLGSIPLTALTLVTTSNMIRVYHHTKEHILLAILYRISFFTYLALAEYDHITVIMGINQSANEIIAANRLLPYSIVFYAVSHVMMLFSFLKNIKVLRQISLFLLVITTLKVFVLDFHSFGAAGQVLTFWLTGGYLLLYSFTFQQFRRRISGTRSTSERKRSRHHRKKRESSQKGISRHQSPEVSSVEPD